MKIRTDQSTQSHPSGTSGIALLLIPLRGQELCQKQVVIRHRGRHPKNNPPDSDPTAISV